MRKEINMTPLPQYHFNRADFVRILEEVLGEDIFTVLDLCSYNSHTANFELWHDDQDEWYIKHVPTGVIINWYKETHVGRTNTCTDPNFTLEDFKMFLTMLKEELPRGTT